MNEELIQLKKPINAKSSKKIPTRRLSVVRKTIKIKNLIPFVQRLTNRVYLVADPASNPWW